MMAFISRIRNVVMDLELALIDPRSILAVSLPRVIALEGSTEYNARVLYLIFPICANH
jgi:hypothetical protein